MWLAVLLFVFILGLLAYLDTKKPPNFPPGPAWLPVVGSGMAIYKIRKYLKNKGSFFSHATTEMAKEYGPLVGLRVGKDRQVVCCYQAVREMLFNEDIDGRPTGPFWEIRTWGSRKGLLVTDEDFWAEQRRFVLRHLKEFGYGRRTMSGLVEEEALQMVALFKQRIQGEKKQKGVVMEMNEAFGIFILNTLWTMLAGIRYNPEDKELKTLQCLLDDLFKSISMVGALFSQFPVLMTVAPEFSGYRKFVNIHQQIWIFLNNELENHKKTFKKDSPRDLMDVYLEMLDSKDRKPSFSETQLLAICMDLFMAGSETTSKTLGFGFLYMLLQPEIQDKAYEEIVRVIGRDRLPLLSDRPNMPYVEAIVLESLRMFMGRAVAIPHRALRDTKLMGYTIPKDTMVVANISSLMMDETFWEEPQEFRPERFIKDGKVSMPERFIPFGLGKHRCMGETLAKSNVFVFTATLLQNFEFRVPEGEEPPSPVGVDGVTPSPGLYHAYITQRPHCK
ncbi:probable cytochrome P450 303a1 [Nilaparvata lugens]|uniref:probable cytochrome P450 303a1 n=1 Tax=Nilaparvata lugens TaxID=108931 RepID=UPI00193C95A5|nr:probable cytochrome P450 303a1 [Nilaparvata lugens]XP_039286577.1 probable cytochrome P450 303a1 [Nilaparvata lugens]